MSYFFIIALAAMTSTQGKTIHTTHTFTVNGDGQSRISDAGISRSFGDDYDFETMFDLMVCTDSISIHFTCNATK